MKCINDSLHQFINTSSKDYYKILNVTKTSSDDEIRKAYLKLSRLYHPDKCKDKHANELFKLISEAYMVLSSSYQSCTDEEINIDDAFDLLLKTIDIDKQTAKLYTKMILQPKDLSFNEAVTIGYSFYKLFVINK